MCIRDSHVARVVTADNLARGAVIAIALGVRDDSAHVADVAGAHADVVGNPRTVSYTHLDVYKRQNTLSLTHHKCCLKPFKRRIAVVIRVTRAHPADGMRGMCSPA